MLMNTLFLLLSFYNGANFYMESFAKKYEKQLQELHKYEEQVTDQTKATDDIIVQQDAQVDQAEPAS